MALFFAGLVIAGAGFGAGFQGAIRSVLLVAEPEARALAGSFARDLRAAGVRILRTRRRPSSPLET